MGIGLGVDSGGELTRFGEVVDPMTRGQILDECAELLVRAWQGEEVTHHGAHLTVDGVTFLPRPVHSHASRCGSLPASGRCDQSAEPAV